MIKCIKRLKHLNMNLGVYFIPLLFFISGKIVVLEALNLPNFYPFGVNEGDHVNPSNDDGGSGRVPISMPFPFFGQSHNSLYINTNGVISFEKNVNQHTPERFPLGDSRQMVAPFWADANTNIGGKVFYRQTTDQGLLQRATADVKTVYDKCKAFRAAWLLIATWYEVAFYNAQGTYKSKTNTFQAVLVTDGIYSFVIFSYNKLTWTTGGASSGNSAGLGGTAAQAGYNAGDGLRYFNIPGSGTDKVLDLTYQSNVAIPGRWMFQLVDNKPGGCDVNGKRKFLVIDITPNVPYDTINWDNESTASFVRVLAPAGAVVTRIGLSNSGYLYTSYRQETVPPSGILCMPSLRNNLAVMQAELDGIPLEPQQPTSFPLNVNPQIRFSKTSTIPPFISLQSFWFRSSTAGSAGPVYARREWSRCYQQISGDLAFKFEQFTKTFQWQGSRMTNNPVDNLYWDRRSLDRRYCFIKVLFTGATPDTVIYVKSTGKAPGKRQRIYGYAAEKSARLGASNEGVACLEYRCNRPSSPNPGWQTHVQLITLTGRCQITRLNPVLQMAQGRCTVTPDADSSQESNFCVPDVIGGSAGLYVGGPALAKSRCLTGDNSYRGASPNPTNANPTVQLTCS